MKMPQSEPHKTVKVWHPLDKADINIDEMIAPLIKKLWENNIWTHSSCQENKPGIIWIQFDPDGLRRFLNIVAEDLTGKQMADWKNFSKTINCRMTHDGSFGQWQYDCNVHDSLEDDSEVNFDVLISVRFPQFDLPGIMKAFNDKRRIKERLCNSFPSSF